MKKFCIAGAVVLTASTVHAQSSVTLYGIIDLGVTYANSAQTGKTGTHIQGSKQIAMSDGTVTGQNGSRWGLRGVEDLGADWKAIFVLENGFTANTGALAQGGAEFGRQAFVGLSSNEGTLTLGRQYDPLLEALQPFSAAGTWAGSMSSPVSDVNNFVSADRANNAIKYASPIWGGFRVSGLYSVGGVAGNLSQNQIWALAATYSRGPLSLAAGYINARDPNVSFYGNTPNKGLATANNIGSFGSATTPETAPGYAGYASAKTREMAGVAAAYTFAQTTVSVIGANTRFESLGSNSGPNPLGYHGSTSFNTAELNVRQRFTPSLLAGAAFDYTRRTSVNADGGATYLQLDLGLDYSLSIRTDVYWIVDLQRAMGRDSLGQSAVADINGFTPSSTDKQVALRVAIKHRF